MNQFDKLSIEIAESLIKHGYIMLPLNKKDCIAIRRLISKILKS